MKIINQISGHSNWSNLQPSLRKRASC